MAASPSPAAAGRPVVEVVTVADIAAFADREAEAAAGAGPDAIVPISRSRARAWAANPHAEPTDAALVVARIDGRIAGYLGLVPWLLAAGDRVEPMSWFSTFFVPEELRGQAVGGLLLMKALSLGRTLAVTGPSAEAAATFEAVGFTARNVTFGAFDGVRHRNYLGLPLRTGRRTLQKLDRPVPGVLDAGIAGLGRLNAAGLLAALHTASTRRFGRWTAEARPDLPPVKAPSGDAPHFVRDEAVLEWMLRHPWTTTDRALSDPRYYFDDHRDVTEYEVVDVRRPGGEAAGWAILWFDARGERRKLQVLDHRIEAGDGAEGLLVVALEAARRHKANDVLVPEACLAALARLGPLGRLFVEGHRVDYHRPHPRSADLLARIRPSFVDGDGPFA